MINIIIADDHQMFIDGIKLLLKSERNIHVIGEAHTGKELLLFLAKQSKPDIILLDINMPEMNGIEATKEIHKQFPGIKILILTMYNTREYVSRLVESGASGYVLKNGGKDELVKAIRQVMQGTNFYSDAVTERVMEGFKKKKTQSEGDLFNLSDREKEILKLIAKEYTNPEIAEKLTLSQYTVETHRKNIVNKLGVRNTAGLVKYAIDSGLLD